MPKLKISKTAAKRFKITGTGKIMRRKAYNSHMFLHKSGARKRRLEKETVLSPGDARRIRKILGI
ncbi:MAG TPA: 50S ribosomal protein L35 [Fimbriimonadales bacterium]|nr:50S ribosomal protein L35 [Fimbriimonadales bacterium]